MKIRYILWILVFGFSFFQCDNGAKESSNQEASTEQAASVQQDSSLDPFRAEYTRIHNLIASDHAGWVAKINAQTFDERVKQKLVEGFQEVVENPTIEEFVQNTAYSAGTMKKFIDGINIQFNMLSK